MSLRETSLNNIEKLLIWLLDALQVEWMSYLSSARGDVAETHFS